MRTLKTIAIALTGGFGGAFLYVQFLGQNALFTELGQEQVANWQRVAYTEQMPAGDPVKEAPIDFTEASASSTQSVVYLKTTSESSYGRTSMLEWFFGSGSGQRVNSGSGVIYSKDGYILTNNHVIEGAHKIEVIHNKRTYEAALVGTDPSTDLAVLKVEAELPPIKLGSSKNLQVGEWVLAVGNPFNLTSTVTAGIVSAKGRELNIVRDRFPIESFIQTDAAINPGNSGGALVNKYGELVGINTAILSRTGSHAGYGFAVPVDIARKIANDIIAYGEVQKAFIGVDAVDLTTKSAEELKYNSLDGVAVSYIQRNGAAEKAGLEKGDVIVAINNDAVSSRTDFEELLSYRSPGDEIKVKYFRNGKEKVTSLVLTNREGTTDVLRRVSYYSKSLEVELEKVPKVEREVLKISAGVRVAKVGNGFFRRLQIPEGFIITAINNQKAEEPEQVAETIERIKGKVVIEGVNNSGVKGYYTFYF